MTQLEDEGGGGVMAVPKRIGQGAHNLYRQYLMSRDLSPADANQLDRLQHLREACDYSPYRSTNAKIRAAIEEAEVIVRRIDKYMTWEQQASLRR